MSVTFPKVFHHRYHQTCRRQRPEGRRPEKRTQLPTKTMGESTSTKRDKTTGKFMDRRKAPAREKFRRVRREKKAG
jgi:hypothetical protein